MKVQSVPASLTDLSSKLGTVWPAIESSFGKALTIKADLRKAFEDEGKLDSEDTSIVAFGSLARNEWTTNSDIDWTLLVDGQVDPGHLEVSHRIRHLLGGKYKPPRPAGAFGEISFSHEIVHRIGGEHDSNRNTTQRVLLLLESEAIGRTEAYDRVVKAILDRYLSQDTSFLTQKGQRLKIPRFLLNDIVRFWKTMAVDFASKQRERAGEGWGLRNIKLRMSRKLIFVSGLLMCMSCYFKPSEAVRQLQMGEASSTEALVNHLLRYVRLTPLEVVVEGLEVYGISDLTSRKLLDSYDAFLTAIDDETTRAHLEKLRSIDAASDHVFMRLREQSHQFGDALVSYLFEENKKLSDIIKVYGVL